MTQYVPSDPAEARAVDQLFSTSPGSLVVGGESYPLASFGSLGLLLNFGAALYAYRDRMDQIAHLSDEDQDAFADAVLFNVASFMQIVKGAPYAKFVDDLAGIFDYDPDDPDDQTRLQEYLSGLAGNMVPYSSLQRQISQNFMEERTRAGVVWDNFYQQFAPYKNHTAYNALSETMPTMKGVLARSREVANDELAANLFRNAMFMPRPARFEMIVPSVGNEPSVKVRLSGDQWNDYHAIVRDELDLRRSLDALSKSESFKQNALAGRYDINTADAMAILNTTRNRALKLLISRDLDLQYNIEQERKEALVIDNVRRTVPAGASVPTFMGE